MHCPATLAVMSGRARRVPEVSDYHLILSEREPTDYDLKSIGAIGG